MRSHTFLSVLSAFVLLWSHALSVQDAAEQAAPARVQIFLDQALALAASLPDGDDKASAYVGIAEVEWKAGAHSEARKHFDLADGVRARMPQDDLTRALRAHLSETRAGVGDIEGALEQLRRFPGDHPGDQEELIRAQMARASARKGEYASASAEISTVKNDTTHDVALGDVSRIAVESGALKEAAALTRQIVDRQARVINLSAIGPEYAKRGHAAEASKLFQEALSLVAQFAAETEKQTSDLDSDNLYPVISMHQADSGDFVGAFSTAEHIVAVESKDAAIQWIAADAAKLGKIEIVRQAMDGLQDAHRQPELNVLMAGALARAGQPKEALDLAKKHLDLTHQALALIYVAQSYLDSGDRMKGLELLGQASQLAHEISDADYRSGTFGEIGRAQLSAGDRASTAKSFAEIPNQRISWRERQDFASEQVKAGDVEGALETAKNTQTLQPAAVYSTIAKTQVQLGESAESIAWIYQLESSSDSIAALLGAAEATLEDHNDKAHGDQ